MSEFMTSPRAHFYFENHNSSRLDANFIDLYITREQAAGRYSQAFLPQDLEDIIGPFRTSPIGLVPKPHSEKLRMIQDMSYPRKHPDVLSVNSSINAADFPTAWGKFDDAVALILALPPGCQAAMFDISAAYRITPIRPGQQNALCIVWRGLVYVDRALMFGLASSAGVFGAIADMLVAIYKAAGYRLIIKWVDDFLVIWLSSESWTEQDFVNLTARIGVPWSPEKTKKFVTTQRYIGFDWNLETKTVALPAEKLARIQELLNRWLQEGSRFSAHDAASLHGKLVHILCIHMLIRPFLRSISAFSLSFTTP
jgi:hypothetical protein